MLARHLVRTPMSVRFDEGKMRKASRPSPPPARTAASSEQSSGSNSTGLILWFPLGLGFGLKIWGAVGFGGVGPSDAALMYITLYHSTVQYRIG